MNASKTDQFANALASDPAARNRLLETVDEGSFLATALTLAREKGIECTENDLRAVVQRSGAASGELNDSHLDTVSGGMAPQELANKCLGSNTFWCYVVAVTSK